MTFAVKTFLAFVSEGLFEEFTALNHFHFFFPTWYT